LAESGTLKAAVQKSAPSSGLVREYSCSRDYTPHTINTIFESHRKIWS